MIFGPAICFVVVKQTSTSFLVLPVVDWVHDRSEHTITELKNVFELLDFCGREFVLVQTGEINPYKARL